MEEALLGIKKIAKWLFIACLAFFILVLVLFLGKVGTVTSKQVIIFGALALVFGILYYWDFIFSGEESLTNKLGAFLEFILGAVAGFSGLTALLRLIWIKDFGTYLVPENFNLWPIFIISLILAFGIYAFRSAFFGEEAEEAEEVEEADDED